jgi:hypothetical protein
MKCDAFPDGVPDRFRFGDDMHVESVEGDHGIQFQLADGLPEASREIALDLVDTWKRAQARNRAVS